MRKNKRRLDQRAASPELGQTQSPPPTPPPAHGLPVARCTSIDVSTEHPRRPHPQFRSNDGHPQFGNANAQLGDPSGINLGAIVMGIPPSFLQPFGADPFSMLATNPNFLNTTVWCAVYPGYLQVCGVPWRTCSRRSEFVSLTLELGTKPSHAFLHRGPLQQLSVQSSSQTPQEPLPV